MTGQAEYTKVSSKGVQGYKRTLYRCDVKSLRNAPQPLTVKMSPTDFAKDGWTVANEVWRRISEEWRPRTMESVVRAETIRIKLRNNVKHFLVLDVYRELLFKLLQLQQLDPERAVLLTGQPGTGWLELHLELSRGSPHRTSSRQDHMAVVSPCCPTRKWR